MYIYLTVSVGMGVYCGGRRIHLCPLFLRSALTSSSCVGVHDQVETILHSQPDLLQVCARVYPAVLRPFHFRARVNLVISNQCRVLLMSRSSTSTFLESWKLEQIDRSQNCPRIPNLVEITGVETDH